LHACLDITRADLDEGKLSEGLEVRNFECDAWDLVYYTQGARERDGVGTCEVVHWQWTKSSIEDTAEVDRDIDWMHAVDIEKKVCGDVEIWFLKKCLDTLRWEK
jgi:hypothetical protein